MPRVTWTELAALYRDMIAGRVRIIGWGAGGSFRLTYGQAPLQLAYLVDRNPALWGQSVYGIPVRTPEALKAEDPATTVVVVYSAYFFGAEIVRQLAALGPFRYVAPFAPALALPQLQRLAAALARPLPEVRPVPVRQGIVLQGAIEADTFTALEVYRRQMPEVPVIVSTWSTTSAAEQERLAAWCDRLVLSPLPTGGGGQGNRRYQRISTQAGLIAAADMGLERVLKLRGDGVVLAPDCLRQAEALRALYPPPPVPACGVRPGRIIVSSRYTQKYIPYNISDIVLYGDTHDLLRYFTPPDDLRAIDIHSPAYRNNSLRTYSRDRAIPEVYFATHYLESCGQVLTWTTEDFWNSVRDYFIVVDEEWFDLLWPKYGQMPVTRHSHATSPRAVVDHYFWQRLHSGDPAALAAEAAAVCLDSTRLEDFFRVQSTEYAGIF